MTKGYSTSWGQLPISLNQLCLATVLRCGQSFRWKLSGPDEWSCGFPDRIISLRQNPTHLHYRATYPSPPSPSSKDDTEDIVRDYFNLSVDLASLYEKWSTADPNFKKKAGEFRGVRMLRQDPWECLIGFICSSNNNISRIGQMVDKLCMTYGKPLGSLTHTSTNPPLASSTPSTINSPTPTQVEYYSFPSIESLTAPDVEETLRKLGFGYRAKYIYNTACMVHNDRPKGFLNTLRDEKNYKEAHEALLEFSGVGPKVADCVCLMSLDKMGAVPVDTHVWQIATRDYKFGKGKHRSLTKAVYDAVGDHFRELWGDTAGWAHSVLFTADLRTFADRLENTKTTTVKTKVKVEVKEEEDEEDSEIKKEEIEEEVVKKVESKRVRKRGADGQVKSETTIVKVEERTERRTRRRRG
ncbi:8-oxoguanine glycosylase ogg1 [Orbilia ellipsospora]|uniref:N-glycosylase/DNA lyase n=1 Tax=Orbilia ellipsospora TaxID=2528407 RepID=A0AAV9XPG6_9PEZI